MDGMQKSIHDTKQLLVEIEKELIDMGVLRTKQSLPKVAKRASIMRPQKRPAVVDFDTVLTPFPNDLDEWVIL